MNRPKISVSGALQRLQQKATSSKPLESYTKSLNDRWKGLSKGSTREVSIRKIINDLPDLPCLAIELSVDENLKYLIYIADQHTLVVPRSQYHMTMDIVTEHIKAMSLEQ